MGKTIDIGGRIHNPEVGNVVAGANEIYDDTKQKKQDVINGEVDIALEALDANKQDNLTFDQTPTEDSTNPVTSGGVYAADQVLQQAIEAILALIPSAASVLNQLADKSFVNSSIATASATFRGTYNLVSDLHLSVSASHQDIATALASAVSTADNNDYCFVQIPTSDTSSDIRVTERYKFNGTAWAYEYDLNNSGFTAQQWEAINSGITALLVTKLGALPTAAELATSLAGKQNVLTFDNVPVSGSDNPVKSSGLYQLFTAIDAKFPSDASSSNKLVAENRLAAYVSAIIEALDASFDVTSTDGHVTFRITQTNGQIASVQILTSDIASASALTTLTGRVSTNETDIANLQAAYAALTQSDVIIVNGALPSSGQQQNKIYRQPDQDHTPPQFYSDYMWNGSVWVLMATYNNAIDNVPVSGSNNLVKSGGVVNSIFGTLLHQASHYYAGIANYTITDAVNFVPGNRMLVRVSASTPISVVAKVNGAYIVLVYLTDDKYHYITMPTGADNILYFSHGDSTPETVNIEVRGLGAGNQFITYHTDLLDEVNELEKDFEEELHPAPIKSYNTGNATEIAIVNAIKKLEIVTYSTVSDSDEFKIVSFGWTASSNLFGYINIFKNGAGFAGGTFDRSQTYPTGTKEYYFHDALNVQTLHMIIDWDAFSSIKWANIPSSTVVINNKCISYVLDNPDMMPTPRYNRFNVNAAKVDTYLTDTTGAEISVVGYVASDYIGVEPNGIYKLNKVITRCVFYNASAQRVRTLTLPNIDKIVKPQTGEVLVRFSYTYDQGLDDAIFAKVDSEYDDLQMASLTLDSPYISRQVYNNMIIEGYKEGEHKIGDAYVSGTTLSLSTEGGDVLIALPTVGTYNGRIKKLHFFCSCSSSFNMTIGVGSIDQRNWGLVANTYTVSVANGENNIDVDIPIGEGQILFVIANSASTAAAASLYLEATGRHYLSGEDEIAMLLSVGAVLVQYIIEGKRMLDSFLATEDSVSSLSEKVSNIGNSLDNLMLSDLLIKSPNETFFKLAVSNEGVLSAVEVPVSGKILIMGNSYEVSGVAPGIWWTESGMAASRKENDWQHVLLRKLRLEDGVIYDFNRCNIAGWETRGWGDYPAFDYSTLDSVFEETYSMVIIRVGENSMDTNLTSIQSRVEALLTYITSKVGNNVPILFGGCVKIRTLQNPAIQAACANFDNVTYVDMEPAGRLDTFAAGLDYRVFGDDGVWHTISESSKAGSVAGHPNDTVFAKMAELFYPVVVDKLL